MTPVISFEPYTTTRKTITIVFTLNYTFQRQQHIIITYYIIIHTFQQHMLIHRIKPSHDTYSRSIIFIKHEKIATNSLAGIRDNSTFRVKTTIVLCHRSLSEPHLLFVSLSKTSSLLRKDAYTCKS